MLASVMEILNSLGLLTPLQFMATAVVAIALYRYFTDRG